MAPQGEGSVRHLLGIVGLALVVAAFLMAFVGCGASPAAPTRTVLGTFGTILDVGCAPMRATVSIDGIVVKTIGAGESATKEVPLGTHTLTGVSVNTTPVMSWTDTRVLTASVPDFIGRAYCR